MIASPTSAAQEPCVSQVVVPEQKPKDTPPVPASPADPSPTPPAGGAAGGAAHPSPALVKEALAGLLLGVMGSVGEPLAQLTKAFTRQADESTALLFLDELAELQERIRRLCTHLVASVQLCTKAEALDWPANLVRTDGRLALLHPSNGMKIIDVPIAAPSRGVLIDAAERWHARREAGEPVPTGPQPAPRCWSCERRQPDADPVKCYHCQADYPARGNPLHRKAAAL